MQLQRTVSSPHLEKLQALAFGDAGRRAQVRVGPVRHERNVKAEIFARRIAEPKSDSAAEFEEMADRIAGSPQPSAQSYRYRKVA